MLENDSITRIRAHTPQSGKESADLLKISKLLEKGEDTFFRDHFLPGHFTASVFIRSLARDATFLIFHKKLKKWLQPGGHIERGDANVWEAAKREALEEVGVSSPLFDSEIIDVDIHDIPRIEGRVEEPAHQHFDIRFVIDCDLSAPKATHEVADGRWFNIKEMDQIASDESVLRVIQKILH